MTSFLEGMSYPARLVSEDCYAGRHDYERIDRHTMQCRQCGARAIQPNVVRVKAWRAPNEDRPAADIVFRRVEAAYLAPLMRTTRELLERRGLHPIAGWLTL